MSRFRRGFAVVVLPLLFSAACGGGTEPAASGTAQSAAPGLPTILSSGFGQQDEYSWITAVVKNDKGAEGHFVTVHFNIFDKAGALIASESQTESFNRPGETLAIGTQVTIDGGAKVGKVEPTVVVGTTTDAKPFPEVKTSSPKIGTQEYAKDRYTVTFTVTNPLAEPLKGIRVGVACFDSAGKVVGGSSEYPDVVPANGPAVVKSDVIVSAKPAKCTAYVGAPV